jgi:hypothetical protein
VAAAVSVLLVVVVGCRSQVDPSTLDRVACSIPLTRRICAPTGLEVEGCRLSVDGKSAGREYGDTWQRWPAPGASASDPGPISPCPDGGVPLEVPDSASGALLLCNAPDGGSCPSAQAQGTVFQCQVAQDGLSADLGPGHTAASLVSDGQRLAAVFGLAQSDEVAASAMGGCEVPTQTVTNLRLQMALLDAGLAITVPPTRVPDRLFGQGAAGTPLDQVHPDGMRPLTWSRPWLTDKGADVLALTDIDTLDCQGGVTQNTPGGLARISLSGNQITPAQLCSDLSYFLFHVDVARGGDDVFGAFSVDCNLLAQGNIDYFCSGDGVLVHPLSTLGTFCTDDLQPQPFPLPGVQAIWSDVGVVYDTVAGFQVPLVATSYFSSTQPPTLVLRVYPDLGIPGEQPSFILSFPQTLVPGAASGFSAPTPPVLVQGVNWGAAVFSSRDLGIRTAMVQSTGGGGVARSELTVAAAGLPDGAPDSVFSSINQAQDPGFTVAADDRSATPDMAVCYSGVFSYLDPAPPYAQHVVPGQYFWSPSFAGGVPAPIKRGGDHSACTVSLAPDGSGARYAMVLGAGPEPQGGPGQLVLDTDLAVGMEAARLIPITDAAGQPLMVGSKRGRYLVKDGDHLLYMEGGNLYSITVDAAAGTARFQPVTGSYPVDAVLRREPTPAGPVVAVLYREVEKGPLLRVELMGGQPVGAPLQSVVPDAERMSVYASGQKQVTVRRVLDPGLAQSMDASAPTLVLATVGADASMPRSVLPRDTRPVSDVVIVGAPRGLPVVGGVFAQGQEVAVGQLNDDFLTLVPATVYSSPSPVRQINAWPVDASGGSSQVTVVLIQNTDGQLVISPVVAGPMVGPGMTGTGRGLTEIGQPGTIDETRAPELVMLAPGVFGASVLVRRGADSAGLNGHHERQLLPVDATGQPLGPPLELGTELAPEASAFAEAGSTAQPDRRLVLARSTVINHGTKLVASSVVDGHVQIREIRCTEVPAK